MKDRSDKDWFKDLESIVAEPLRFKVKLNIGEEAYATLRLKNTASSAFDAASAATTGAIVASSPVVASTFFAPTGILSLLGIGAAVTPLGWVVAASVITGGAWVGVSQYVKKSTSGKVNVIPQFINTPMDVLGLGIFDLLAPLALKVAEVDDCIVESERELINSYFVKEWGYNKDFVREGLALTESILNDYSLIGVAETLAEFKKQNPDCNYESMSAEILNFVTEIIEADGRIDVREKEALERIRIIFDEVNQSIFARTFNQSVDGISTTAGILKDAVSAVPVKKALTSSWDSISGTTGELGKAISGVPVKEPLSKVWTSVSDGAENLGNKVASIPVKSSLDKGWRTLKGMVKPKSED